MTTVTFAKGFSVRSVLPAPRALGPALRPRRMPMAAITISAIGHGVLALALVAAFLWGGWQTSKVHVVNLVPAIAAVGIPTAPPAPVVAPVPPAPPPLPKRPAEPEPREARAREVKLPDTPIATPRLPTRPAALPRAGEKELPPLGTPAERRPAPAPEAATARAERPVEARPAPPAPAGQTTGSVSGSGALSLDVSDFPHAWYLRQILQKVEDRWQRQPKGSEPEQKPLVFVEIQRDGSIRTPRVEKSSGNAFYDQAALRAIADASPFPPLPADWAKPSLRVMFRFDLRSERG